MTASTDWQQGVNWMTKASVASTCGLLRAPWHLNINSPPSSTSRWRPGEPETPTGTLHRATRFFREALSQTFPLLPPQAKRFQDTSRPSESEQLRANLLESVPLFLLFLSSKNNSKSKKEKESIFYSMDPLDLRPMRWWHMHACIWTSKEWVPNLGGTI